MPFVHATECATWDGRLCDKQCRVRLAELEEEAALGDEIFRGIRDGIRMAAQLRCGAGSYEGVDSAATDLMNLVLVDNDCLTRATLLKVSGWNRSSYYFGRLIAKASLEDDDRTASIKTAIRPRHLRIREALSKSPLWLLDIACSNYPSLCTCGLPGCRQELMTTKNYSAPIAPTTTPLADAAVARAALRRPDTVTDMRVGLMLPFLGSELIAMLRDRAALYAREAEDLAEQQRKYESEMNSDIKRAKDRTIHSPDGVAYTAVPPSPALMMGLLPEDLARSGREILMVAGRIDPAGRYELSLSDLSNLGLYAPKLHRH